jgi:CBS domain-containing protein
MLSPKLQVRDAMTFMPDTVGPDVSLQDAIRMMRVNRYRHLPVALAGKPVGIVSDRDLSWACSLGLAESTRVSEIMTTCLHTATPGQPLLEALDALVENRLGSVVVVDPQDAVLGILTTTDLVRLLRELLEERALPCGMRGSA